MNVAALARNLPNEADQRHYITRMEILDQSANLLKARLYLSVETFVQVYRNDRFDTTNLVLIHNGQRIYARDQLDGLWHRHPVNDPAMHDGSQEGRRSVNLTAFLDEVEEILAAMDLP